MFGCTNILVFSIMQSYSCKVKLYEVTDINTVCVFTGIFHLVVDWWGPGLHVFVIFTSTVELP